MLYTTVVRGNFMKKEVKKVPRPKTRSVIVIEEFMQKELSLRGSELLIYAVIYSFCKREGGRFYAAVSYLAERSSVTSRTVYNALRSLVGKGYIERLGKNEVFGTVEYRTTYKEEYEEDEEYCDTENVDINSYSDNYRDYNEEHADIPQEYVMPIDDNITYGGNGGKGGYGCKGGNGGMGGNGGSGERCSQSNALYDGYFSERDVPELDIPRRLGGNDVPDFDKYKYYYMNGFEPYGKYELVLLTPDQYYFIKNWVGEEVLHEYIERLDNVLLTKRGFRSFSHFRTIKKWIMMDMRV